MKTQKTLSRILDVLILLVFILFFSSVGFQDRNTSGWYQQWFPNLNGSSITSITFLDSLTGCAVTNTNSSLEGYILRTSNGGDNWNIVYTYTPTAGTISFNKIAFADANTGFATVNYYPFFKTTNAGLNWFIVSNTFSGANDMSVINIDTILLVNSDIMGGGVFRSTNGGINWAPLGQVGGNGQPSRIYMFDKNLGFTISNNGMRRTTNGGFNWTIIPGESFTDIKFSDSLKGWKTDLGIKKTTDGGINWFSQQVPSTATNYYRSISILNKDTVWACGPPKLVNNKYLGIILKTTNGGLNWGYQFADTLTEHDGYYYINFINKINGWAYPYFWGDTLYREIHTNTGGNDTTFLTGVNIIVTITPKDYKLYQNYPNPFNTGTFVRCQLSIAGNVSIKVYDIQGREVQTLIEKRLNPGEYSVSFNGNNLSSGIYFYTLYVNDKLIETKRMTLLK